MLTCREIAERYAGQTLKCKVTTSLPVTDINGHILDYFDACIIGWKEGTIISPSYVCVEVLSPGTTKTQLWLFNTGYHYTFKRNNNGFGKKLLPKEIIIPDHPNVTAIIAESTKVIPEWPDKCRDCGSPAVIMSTRIDCSNLLCKNKFRTHSGLDLFLPKEMRPPGWEKDPFRKRRQGVDKEDFIVCDVCHVRANSGTFIKGKIGTFEVNCSNNHTWVFELNIGDKLVSKNGVLIYKGKNIFIPYRI